MQSITGTNTLYYELECPFCAKTVQSGIGFRVGAVRQYRYRLGDTLKWEGGPCRPAQRPQNGDLKTIGYFNCDNPRCSTWKDCFPDVQEAVITIKSDVIEDVKVLTYKPTEHTFDIIEPAGLS